MVNPLKRGTGSNLVDLGRAAVREDLFDGAATLMSVTNVDQEASRVDRARRRRHGQATYRLLRHADDFVVMTAGTQAHAEQLKTEQLKTEVAEVLAGVGLYRPLR